MSLKGHVILIIEPNILISAGLEWELDRVDALSLVVREPRGGRGLEYIRRSDFSAAAVNVQFGEVAKALPVPLVLYGNDDQPGQIVARLAALLA